MRFPRRRGAFATALALTLVAPAAALAAPPTSRSHPELSQRLAELSTPGLRDAPVGQQARAVDLPRSGPASIARVGDNVVVEVRFAHGAADAVDRLEAAGAHVEHVSTRYQTITADVDPSNLRAVSDVAGVLSVTESLAPMVGGLGDGSQAGTACPVGDAISEGDAQLNADAMRSAL